MEEHKVLVTDEGELPNLPEGMKRATEDEMFQPADAPRVRSFIVFFEKKRAQRRVFRVYKFFNFLGKISSNSRHTSSSFSRAFIISLE